ncbi:hypothetical protein NDU88_005490 [Pleurodeles waltl]|uniref:Uncharacterized protein n=1 Tax=Pleurodeles waltl TaxID=8319 RepID=A0AAV7LP89_PLEWA|nr:hypothetical protein NDU88_005490 [Pleurodeles waltl]
MCVREAGTLPTGLGSKAPQVPRFTADAVAAGPGERLSRVHLTASSSPAQSVMPQVGFPSTACRKRYYMGGPTRQMSIRWVGLCRVPPGLYSTMERTIHPKDRAPPEGMNKGRVIAHGHSVKPSYTESVSSN